MRIALLGTLVCLSACGGVVNETTVTGCDPTDASPAATTDARDAGPGYEDVPDDGSGCQVTEVTAAISGGTTVYTHQLSDPSPAATYAIFEATPTNFTITCFAGTAIRMRVRSVAPYTGFGVYELPVGALEIEGRTSDRPCRISLSTGTPPNVRGFASCDREPYSDGNVFALLGTPLGMAAIDGYPR